MSREHSANNKMISEISSQLPPTNEPLCSLALGAGWESGNCTLYNADCMDILPALTGFDAVITSPPYNIGGAPWEHLGNWKPGDAAGGRSKWRNGSDAGNGIQYGMHDDSMPWADYVAWQHALLTTLWDKLPDDGAIFYNHKPRVIGAKLWLPLELIPGPVVLRQIIVWARPGGMNYNPTAFVPTHEWIMLLAKPAFRLKSKGVSGLGDVWQMTPERNEHPAPFPVLLPSKVLEATTAETILDPFMGSGTTGVACVRAGRKFIGIEKDPRHFAQAVERIKREQAHGDFFASPNGADVARARKESNE